jgi:hypothetical protein
MSRPWLKLHIDLLRNQKFFLLDEGAPSETWVWIHCLALYNRDGSIPPLDNLGWALRIDQETAAYIGERLVAKRFLNVLEDLTLKPHDWDDWQEPERPQSSGAKRQARYRENRKRNEAPKTNGASHPSPPVTLVTPVTSPVTPVTRDVTRHQIEREREIERESKKETLGAPVLKAATLSSAARAREVEEAAAQDAARAKWDDLEKRLMAVVPKGASTWPIMSGLSPLGPMQQLLDEGYDLDDHILPSIREQCEKRLSKEGTIGQWLYFVAGIREYRRKVETRPKTELERHLENSIAARASAEGTPNQETQVYRLEHWCKQHGAYWPIEWGPLPDNPDGYLDKLRGYSVDVLAYFGCKSSVLDTDEKLAAYRLEKFMPRLVENWLASGHWGDPVPTEPPDHPDAPEGLKALWQAIAGHQLDAQGRKVSPPRVRHTGSPVQ